MKKFFLPSSQTISFQSQGRNLVPLSGVPPQPPNPAGLLLLLLLLLTWQKIMA